LITHGSRLQEKGFRSLTFVGPIRSPYRTCGRPVEAAADLRRAVGLMERLTRPGGGELYNLARSLSLLSDVAADPGSALSADDGRAAADGAMAVPRRVAATGWRDAAGMMADLELAPIRSRPDFRLLAMDLAFPDDPFGDEPDRAGNPDRPGLPMTR